MHLENQSPLSAERLCFVDGAGDEHLVVVIKGTWHVADGALSLAQEQVPVRSVAAYSGEPGKSSLVYPSDAVPAKPATDCLLVGQVHAPSRDTTQLAVRFAVGPVARTLAVFGERRWVRDGGDWLITRPRPFLTMPLVYELAFGGGDSSGEVPEHCPANPVGVGFLASKSRQQPSGGLLPNLEDPDRLVAEPHDRPPPAGFGPIAPGWAPRAAYAGTYDAGWLADRAPLLPDDFDPRFYCSAPPGLAATPHLAGNERVTVDGVTRSGRLRFHLPGVQPRVVVRVGLSRQALTPRLDTLIVEPDLARVQLVWRAALEVTERLYDVRWIRVRLEGLS